MCVGVFLTCHYVFDAHGAAFFANTWRSVFFFLLSHMHLLSKLVYLPVNTHNGLNECTHFRQFGAEEPDTDAQRDSFHRVNLKL